MPSIQSEPVYRLAAWRQSPYIPGEVVSKLKGPCGEFRVVEILVLGVLTEDGFQFRDDPVSYFAVFPSNVVTISLNEVQEHVPAYSHPH